MCEYYLKNFEKNTVESLNSLNYFMSQFPDLQKIKQIIALKLFSNLKELSVLKVILDLYEHYCKNFDFPTYDKLLNEYIPVAELFYCEFPSSNYSVIYEYLKDQYEVFEILTKKLNVHLYKFPSFHLKNLDKIKDYYKNLVDGIDFTKFLN